MITSRLKHAVNENGFNMMDSDMRREYDAVKDK